MRCDKTTFHTRQLHFSATDQCDRCCYTKPFHSSSCKHKASLFLMSDMRCLPVLLTLISIQKSYALRLQYHYHHRHHKIIHKVHVIKLSKATVLTTVLYMLRIITYITLGQFSRALKMHQTYDENEVWWTRLQPFSPSSMELATISSSNNNWY